ncbi:MAG TPA: hypothetical protein VIO61_00170 [Anaerolineaceae bacterium]
MNKYRAMGRDRTPADFQKHIQSLGIDLPFDPQVETGASSPLAQPYTLRSGFTIGNRFAIHPMEGWDGTEDGKPSEYTIRRWRRFGMSGAKLIWGGEAVAVRHDGRANPNQLLINPANLPDLKALRLALVQEHERSHGSSQDLLIGLQLTHSGRFSKPNSKTKMEPVIAYHHPYLDEKFGIPPDYPVISDQQIEALVGDFLNAAEMAAEAGFAFVDIKHCHGYLGHELLSAYYRPGDFGGSFENRTRFLRMVTAGIRQRLPQMQIGVRLSAFDMPPFARHPETGVGVPPTSLKDDRCYWFGANPRNPLEIDLTEVFQFMELLCSLDIQLVNLTAGSPYYIPHIQRPALFPPSDGYLPPEDPLVGVARHVRVAAEVKQRFPDLAVVGTGYTYLQEWLPNVAQHNVRAGKVDFVGLGRMVLSYPCLPADVLSGSELDRRHICRTFSDCTTAPRSGLISGCFPLDEYYKALPEAATLEQKKAALKPK